MTSFSEKNTTRVEIIITVSVASINTQKNITGFDCSIGKSLCIFHKPVNSCFFSNRDKRKSNGVKFVCSTTCTGTLDRKRTHVISKETRSTSFVERLIFKVKEGIVHFHHQFSFPFFFQGVEVLLLIWP